MNKQSKLNKRINQLSNVVNSLKSKPRNQKKMAGKRNKGRRTKSKSSISSNPYMTMLANPCMTPLKAGIYGSVRGLMASVDNIVSVNSAFTGSNYYVVLWFPDFHAPATTTSGNANLFVFGSTNSATNPLQSSYGATNSATTSTAHSKTDPAFPLIVSDTAMDARTYSACIKTTYVGSTSTATGMIFPLTNLDPMMLIAGGNSSSPPTFDDWLTYAGDGIRADQSAEVRFRPNSESNLFKDNLFGALVCSSGANPSLTAGKEASTGIGLLFYGINSINNYLTQCVKTVEWRPEPISGLQRVVPTGIEDPSVLSKTLKTLDAVAPSWQTRAARTGIDIVSSAIAKMALGGGPGLRQPSTGINYIMDSLGNELR